MNDGRAWPALVGFGLLGVLASCSRRPLTVGSKNFTEQIILGELLAQQLEAHLARPVSRTLNLGGTVVCHRALVHEEIHAYVEYTGTALTTILKMSVPTDGSSALGTVRQAYLQQFDLDWLPPLGFNNSFAIIVRTDDARRLRLSTISDLARWAPRLRATFGYEFLERPDGFPGLAKAYGLRFAEQPRVMDLALTYHALVEKKADVIAGDTTNGLIEGLRLTVLTDDKRFFPRYDAAPVISRRAAERVPGFREALAALAGRVSEDDMRRLNYEVDGRRRDPATVIKEFRGLKRL
jgi:glycine betaine/choline ABC-type transport system substrate-binding protein